MHGRMESFFFFFFSFSTLKTKLKWYWEFRLSLVGSKIGRFGPKLGWEDYGKLGVLEALREPMMVKT